MIEYTTHDVPVRGGGLRVGRWSAGAAADSELAEPTVVLAVHGITANHLTWPLFAERIVAPGVSVLAPDLRGRGRSAELPGPYGLAQHGADLAAVLDTLAPAARCLLVGHSMGGFVAVALAAARPDLVDGVVLVDGGIPLTLPEGWTLAASVQAGLGPAAARLEMSFADHEEYREFWRQHPALGPDLSPVVSDYVDYDLRPDGGSWRPSCRVEAMAEDSAEQFAGGPADLAWPRVSAPVTFLRAPRGLLDEPGGLYPEPALSHWLAAHPQVQRRDVSGVNHYTITLGATGAEAVAGAVTELLTAPLASARPAG